MFTSISVLWHDCEETSEYSGSDEMNQENISWKIQFTKAEAGINKYTVVETQKFQR